MRTFAYTTLDVFTEHRFGGNPLAVFTDAIGLTDEEMQSLAAEMNLSETTFVLPPTDPSNTARVRIFNRTTEMPFAGHPTIGTAYALASGKLRGSTSLTLEVPAGIVQVEIVTDSEGRPRGATIAAPQPLSMGEDIPAQVIAACLGLREQEIITATHLPLVASVGNPYVVAQVDIKALSECVPDVPAFRRASEDRPHMNGRFSVVVYAWVGKQLRARMFAPLAGTWEDPATGSAAAPLGALLLHHSNEKHRRFEIRQGVEMGRPSLLVVEARWQPEGITATVSGRCVPVFTGSLELDVQSQT